MAAAVVAGEVSMTAAEDAFSAEAAVVDVEEEAVPVRQGVGTRRSAPLQAEGDPEVHIEASVRHRPVY